MRLKDIKFKAKRLTDGSWVEGYLTALSDNRYGIDYLADWGDGVLVPVTCEVDPSTVCQYTGLKDKDGKDIWEHDLVENTFDEVEVVYNSKGACFDFVYPNDSRCAIVAEIDSDMKVIGSKFDKKEGK